MLMRSLALLGLLSVVGCGLELGGVATSSTAQPDAAVDDTSTTAEAGPPVDGGADTAGDTAGDVSAIVDGAGADATASDSTGGGSDAVAVGSPDAMADSMSPASDGAADAPPTDGPLEATPDAPPLSACLSAIPSGWSLVIYDLGSDPCPPTFPAHDVFGPTTLEAGACSCGCAVAQEGNCAQGTLSVHPSSGGNSACDLDAGWSKDLDGSACTPLGITLIVSGPHSDLSTPLVGQGGTCADRVQSDPSKLAAADARYCDVPGATADSVCNGTVSSGFAACIIADGDTACPAGSPFVYPYLVDDNAALECSSCAGCTVATTCSNALLTGFADNVCSSQNLIGSVGIDGGCNPVNLYTSPAPLVAVEYTATASSICTPGTSTPGAQLSNPRTICCR